MNLFYGIPQLSFLALIGVREFGCAAVLFLTIRLGVSGHVLDFCGFFGRLRYRA